MASVETLKNEIEKIKQNLCRTDESIKRITGSENRQFFPNRGISHVDEDFRKSDNFGYNTRPAMPLRDIGVRKRLSSGLMTGPPQRQRRFNSSNPHNRDSADEEEDYHANHNMTLASSVIAPNNDDKCRNEVIRQQNKDREGSARNKRMFGLLMGTLQQFKADERKNEQQERKRKEVERKLEEKQKEEKKRLKQEKDVLFNSKKQQQIKLKKLELKMELVELHEIWEEQSKQLTHFIRTESKPNIYYLPKMHNETTLKKLDASRKLIKAIVTKRRNILNDDINKVLNTDHFDDDENEEELGIQMKRNAKNNKENKGNKLPKVQDDDFDLDINKNEAVNIDYQPAVDQSNKPHFKKDIINNIGESVKEAGEDGSINEEVILDDVANGGCGKTQNAGENISSIRNDNNTNLTNDDSIAESGIAIDNNINISAINHGNKDDNRNVEESQNANNKDIGEDSNNMIKDFNNDDEKNKNIEDDMANDHSSVKITNNDNNAIDKNDNMTETIET